MTTISQLRSREVLDSRGTPTVQVDVTLSDGAWGRASVPSGASTGTYEALELRDGDPDRFNGLGVLKAIENIRQYLSPEIIGHSALDQQAVDNLLISVDGTPDKHRLGANAVLGVSMAVARAAARSVDRPLYRYLSYGKPPVLPVPVLNIVNGGKHAEDSADIQEYMVVPAGFDTFGRALRAGVETYHALKELLRTRRLGTTVGDEGGYAPSVSTNHEAVELILAAIEKAGYAPGTECYIALDVAASELLVEHDGLYSFATEGLTLTSGELIEKYDTWVGRYPIISIEDGMAEEDWESWSNLTAKMGERVQLVGDDLYATNTTRIQRGIDQRASNAVLVKPNQIGTLTETLQAVEMAKGADWGTMMSHRSGETEDTTIADLAVATSAGQIKAGAPARGERTAKYNRLLQIEEELGDKAVFAGRSVYESFTRHR